MNWTMPGVLDIYSVGDGELLYQIINTIAMFNNLGTLRTLAMIGLMIGLLLGPLKYVVSGGKDVDIAGPFAAILLVVLFFGGTATVRIHDVSGANSGGAVPTYNVANVPAGLAITGWIVSGVGFKLAERYEQGFTYPSQQMTKSGFGRSAEMLASIRQARRCIGNSAVKDFCLSLVNYLRDCSTAAFVADPTRASKAMVAADPLDSTNGFGVDTGWISTQMVVGGTASTVTCSAALGSLRLRGQTQDSVLDGFAQGAVGLTVPQYADANAADRIGDAYNAISRSVTDAKQMMLAEMIRGTWAKAMVGNPNLTSDQELANVAMIEASEQQATQAALGDTVFRQFIQPLLAVIEGILYVVAPFLAIALGLGRIGASFALKIVIFGLWSMTWMPMLSFINFFQLMMVERAVDAMTSANALSSYAGAQLVGEGVSRWVTVGSWMAAAVPALTYGLLSGSASGIMKMASGAAGGADGKEKGLSPDVATQSAAMQTSALATSTPGGGIVKTGAPEVKMDFGRLSSNMVESTSTAANASSTSWMSSHGKEVGNALTSEWALSAGATARDNYEGRTAEAVMKEALKGSSVSFDTSNRTAQQFVTGLAISAGMSGGVSSDMAFGALKKLSGPVLQALGAATGADGSGSGEVSRTSGSRKSGSVGANAGMSSEDSLRDIAEVFASAANALRSEMRKSHSARSEVIGAASDSLERASKLSGGDRDSVSKASGWKKDAQDVQRTEDAFRNAQSFQRSASIGESISVPQAVAAAMGSPAAEAAINAAANQYGSHDARRATLAAVSASGHYPGDRDGRQAMLASSIMMLAGETMGTGQPSGYADERGAALIGALRSVGLVQTGGEFAAPGISGEKPNSSVDTSAVEKGGAKSAVGGADVGADAGTEGQVSATNQNLRTFAGSKNAQDKAANDVGINAEVVRAESADAGANKADSPGGRPEFGGGQGAAAAVEATNQQNSEGVRFRQSIVSDQIENQAAGQDADEYAGTGYAGLGGSRAGGGLALATGSEKPRNEKFGGEGQPANNPQLRQYQAYAARGGFTEAREVDNPDAALVLGAMALENKNGGFNGALSPEQRQMVRDAWERLPDNTKQDIARVNETWHVGEDAPRSVPPDAFRKE